MPANGGKNARKTFGQFDGVPAAFEIGADGNNFGDARGLGARNDFRQILCVVLIIKMRVGVVEKSHENN